MQNDESVRGADFNTCCLKSSVTASAASECCSACHQSGVFDVTHMTYDAGTCKCYSIPGNICPLCYCLPFLEGRDVGGIANPQLKTFQQNSAFLARGDTTYLHQIIWDFCGIVNPQLNTFQQKSAFFTSGEKLYHERHFGTKMFLKHIMMQFSVDTSLKNYQKLLPFKIYTHMLVCVSFCQ